MLPFFPFYLYQPDAEPPKAWPILVIVGVALALFILLA